MENNIVNTEAICDAFVKISGSLSSEERETITAIYSNYADVLETEITDETPYHITNDYNSHLLQFIAEASLRYPEKFRGLYKTVICYADFYNRVYAHEYESLFNDTFYKFSHAVQKFYSHLSLPKLLNDLEWFDDTCGISEYDFYELLKSLSPADANRSISALDVDNSLRTQLKSLFIYNEEDAFVNQLIDMNVRWEPIACAVHLWDTLGEVSSCLSSIGVMSSPVDVSEEATANPLQEQEGLLKNSEFFSDELYDSLIALQQGTQDNNAARIFSADYSCLYHSFFQYLAQSIEVFHAFKKHVADITVVNEMQKIIDSNDCLSYFNQVVRKDNEIPEDIIESYKLAVMEEFKKQFISELSIPESVKGKKKDFSQYFSGDRTLRYENMRVVYEILTRENLIEWNNSTFHAFMYRTASDYAPIIESVDVIKWYGAPRDLVALVYRLFDGDSRKVAKMGKFFCAPTGKTFKTNGVANQKNPSDRMKRIFSDFPPPLNT